MSSESREAEKEELRKELIRLAVVAAGYAIGSAYSGRQRPRVVSRVNETPETLMVVTVAIYAYSVGLLTALWVLS